MQLFVESQCDFAKAFNLLFTFLAFNKEQIYMVSYKTDMHFPETIVVF